MAEIDEKALEAALKAWDDAYMLSAHDAMKLAIQAYEAAKPRAREGWKLVPVEPTEQMMREGADFLSITPGGATNKCAGNVYEAMLAAAPEET